jgi:glucosamine--fructose-6-phosphate aminotransferase (isomerizing)
VVVIHNGIVENYRALKEMLLAKGHSFRSETDTEVIPHLIEEALKEGGNLEAAVGRAMRQMEGAHALVTFTRREPGKLVAARVGNAGGVVVGYGRDEMFLASDLPALLPHTHSVAFLADGEIAAVTPCGASYLTAAGEELTKQAQTVPMTLRRSGNASTSPGDLRAAGVRPDTIRGRVLFDQPARSGGRTSAAAPARQRAVLVGMVPACTPPWSAATTSSRSPGCHRVDNASEFRYRGPCWPGHARDRRWSIRRRWTPGCHGRRRRQGAPRSPCAMWRQLPRARRRRRYTRCGLRWRLQYQDVHRRHSRPLLLACYLAQSGNSGAME